jgi:hypothetical protein
MLPHPHWQYEKPARLESCLAEAGAVGIALPEASYPGFLATLTGDCEGRGLASR